MTRTEHLNAIAARCRELLAKAEGRTPGEWRMHDMERATVVAGRPGGEVANTLNGFGHITRNAAFIAACAGSAEAGWLATIAAIEGLREIEREIESDGDEDGPTTAALRAADSLDAIIALWPVELLGVCDGN